MSIKDATHSNIFCPFFLSCSKISWQISTSNIFSRTASIYSQEHIPPGILHSTGMTQVLS